VGKAGYTISTSGAVAFAPGVTKSFIGLRAPATFGCDLKKFRISFDGTGASSAAVVQLCLATFATNPPGTNSTAIPVNQGYGRSIPAGFTAAVDWTVEPTILVVVSEFVLSTSLGGLFYDYPLGDSPDCDINQGYVARCALPAPATAKVRASAWFERC
jgi:hypothetical protein